MVSRAAGGAERLKEGAALIAIAAGVPIVPVAVTGTREIMPMGSLRMVPGRVYVAIGEPIPTEGLTPRDRGKLTLQVREQIEGMLAGLPKTAA